MFLYGKNDFAVISKNLPKYKAEDNFVESLKYLEEGRKLKPW